MQQNQSNQSADTERMAESTMNQGQQAMEQLIDFQRNVARMTLSALEWQETAQKQGLEMTRSIFQNAPGQQFTETMMRSYLQGVEAMMPEMEQAMERGFEAAAQPQMNQMEQMTGQQGQFAEGGRRGQQRPPQYGTGGQTGQQTRGATGQQEFGQQSGTPTAQQQGMEEASQQGAGGRSQHQSQQYSQTGEWVSPGEYGGESAGATGSQQQPMTTQPSQFGQGRQQERQHQGMHQRGEPQQYQSTETRQGQERRGGEYGQPGQRQQSPVQTGHGHSQERHAQRIDPDRRGQGEQYRPSGQGQQGQHDQRRSSSSRGSETGSSEYDRGRGEMDATNESAEMDESGIQSDRSAQSTASDTDSDEGHDTEEE